MTSRTPLDATGAARWVLLLAPSLLLLLWIAARPHPPDWGERADTGFRPEASVRIDHHLVYARYGNRSLHLDLYRPATVSRHALPGVVVIRGGGYRHGDSRGYAFIAAYLAQSGFAAACIQYRTSMEAGFPAAVQDAKAAVRWLRANAAEYRINPDSIGVIGGSAGGHLAALLATTEGIAELEGNGGNRGVSSGVVAAVAMGAPADLVDMSPYPKEAVFLMEQFIGSPLDRFVAERRAASPAAHVTRGSAPILLVHSDSDRSIPYEQARLLQRKYVDAAAVAELLTINDGPHDPWNYVRWFPTVMERSVTFLKEAAAASGRNR